MKRVETILDDDDYSSYEKASAEEGRSMRLQTQYLIRNFLKERGQKIKKKKIVNTKLSTKR
jgi:hypothetical protein